MTTAPPSEFNPTGVWLDHFLGTREPPMDLFGEFARRGGRGIILNGGTGGPEPTPRAQTYDPDRLTTIIGPALLRVA